MNLTKIIFLLFAGFLNYYSSALAGEFDGDFSLPPALLLDLDKHMDMINHANTWVQGSVDTLNDLFMTNAGLPLADWKEYFRSYFETRYFSENLQYYIQHPTFWWLDDPTHDMLQKAWISGLVYLQNRLLSSASTSLALSDSLYSNDSFGNSLLYIHFHLHRYFAQPGTHYINSEARDSALLYTQDLIGNYPEYFTKSSSIDNIQFPYLFAVRTQVLSNVSSAVRLDPSLQANITSILNFNSVPESIQLELWNNHQIMVIDNLELSTLHLSAIKAYAEKVPSQLHNWNVFGHYDPLDESLSSYFIPGNYFGNTWRSGYNIPTSLNFFPDNTKTHYSDFYSTYIALGLATMINQVTLLGTNPELGAYRDLLLTIAGNTPENYAKPPYGTEYQQGAFFPNHLVLYHASSQNFLNLALERWEEGLPYQISQFLLFANLYAVHPDSTILFEIDDEANHTCQKLYIEKDISGFINKLYLNDSCWYEFVLDDDHMVIAVIDSTTNCNPVLDCVNTCPDLVNYPDFCALMAFYESTCGPEWTTNSGWADGFAGTDCNYTNWYGITCDENNRVISIDLSYSGNNLQGKLPPEIGDLTELQTLNLQFNHLYGEIPVELWSLTELQSLDLAFNALEGNLDMICNLGNLTTLLLYRNKLSGAIPACINQLTQLTTLDISNNNLSGTLPDQLYALNLSTLSIAGNQFTGSISEEIGNMSNLNLFDFSYNGFDGALPTSLGVLINLQYLYGMANNLTGIIPDVFDQSRLLRWVDLSHNNLNGDLPSSLGFITTLNFLNLFSNNLSGCIPLSYKNFCTTQSSANYSYFNFNNNAGLPNNGDISSFCTDETGVCTLEPHCGLIKFRIVTGTNPIDLDWSFAGFGEVTSHSGSYASFLPNQDTLDYLLDLNQVWYKFSIYNLEGGGLGTGYFEIWDYVTDALLVANKPFDDYYSAQEFPVCEAPEYHNKFLVTNTNDSGPGSLRDAILKTREQFGHDTIEVLTAGVIELEQSDPSSFDLLPSLGDVTFNGNGIIIDANQLGRHMQTFGNVRINNVTFKNGNSPSSAGAIWAGGQSDGDSLVLDCVLFENNRAQSYYVGGGAFRTAKNTVVKAINCTFSGNIADYNGGAVDLEPGSVFIAEYCTFSGNTAGGFGGAIHNNQGFLYLTNTILANSMPPGVDDLYNAPSASAARASAAGIPINNNNLVVQCGGDCPGFTIQGLDPLLGPLMDNGGSTFTHALLAGSPAISTEPDANPISDGRGYVGTDRRDIGAYEANAVDPDGCDPTEFVGMTINNGDNTLVNAHMLIVAENLITSGSNVNFRAANFVELRPAFSVDGGSVLEVVIGDCIK